MAGSPAAASGLAPGMQVVSVDGRRYTEQGLRDAIARSKDTSKPLILEIQNDDVTTRVSLDYHGGTRQPHLVRDPAAPDLLTAILAPRAR